MERRFSARVQFFQLATENQLTPIWVFQRTRENSTLGLVVDISDYGVQILTDKSTPLPNSAYELIAHSDAEAQAMYPSILVVRRWSKAEGALYIRNGFLFDSPPKALPLITALRRTHSTNQPWYRCELAAIDDP